MENKRNIILPTNPQGKDYVDLKPGEDLVIVGANSAGKTRLGKKIDELNDICRMISANWDLTMPGTFAMPETIGKDLNVYIDDFSGDNKHNQKNNSIFSIATNTISKDIGNKLTYKRLING